MKGRLLRTVIGVLALGCLSGLGAKTARELAAERYRHARVLLEDLTAVPDGELGERQYLLVIDALKSVHRASPSSSYCDDALVAVGDVYAAMAARFGADPWRRKATEAYAYVIHEYPHSRLLDKAWASMKALDSGARATLAQAQPKSDPEDEKEEIAAAAPAPARATAPVEAVVQTVSNEPAEPSESAGSSPDSITLANGRAQPSPERLKSGVAAISSVRHYSHDDSTRIVLDLDDYAPYKFDFLSRPSRMYFDLLSSRFEDVELRRGVEIEVGDNQIARIRAAQNRTNKARIVLDLTAEVSYDISWLTNPPRLVIDLRRVGAPQVQTLARVEASAQSPAERPAVPTPPAKAKPEPAPEPAKPQTFAEAFRALSTGGRSAARASQASPPSGVAARIETPQAAPSQEPEVHLAKAEPPPAPVSSELAPPKPAEATSRGSQSLIRALGLKIGRVVIDAGHGGHDPGNIGPSGLQEKDVVLDVSMRLGKLIETKLGAEVVYTRQDDRFLELSDRPKVANDAGADLFISVHANAYSSSSVRGIETFYLNFTADPWALKVASRENAASSHSVHELQDLLGKIALKEKIDESREFALKMQGSLYGGLSKETAGLKNRGVRQAPLIVLIGAKMPAILAEIGFLSNPTDEKLFKSSAYREKVAEQLFSGIESYMKSLSSHSLTMTDKDSASASLD